MGDRNTKYLSTLACRRRNRILAMKDSSNSWIHEEDVLKSMVQEFFVQLYCEMLQ